MITFMVENYVHVNAIGHTMACLLRHKETLRICSYCASPSLLTDVSISYGHAIPDIHARQHLHIQEDGRLWDLYGEASSAPNEDHVVSFIGFQSGTNREVPLVYGNSDQKEYIKVKNSDRGRIVILEADLIASAYYLISRYEEILSEEVDDGLFCRKKDWLIRHSLQDRPLVDEYGCIVEDLLVDQLNKSLDIKDTGPSLLLTHDIDWLRKHDTMALSAKAAALSALVFHSPLQAIRDLAEIAPVRFRLAIDPYLAGIDWLMACSEKYDWTSHLFFMAGGHTRHDGYYQPDHPLMPYIIDNIVKRGHRIGVHPSYNTYNDMRLIEKEKNTLERLYGLEIQGGRQHFLRFGMPETWHYYAACGMVYDCSLGYSGRNGFRCGTCHPFQAFDPAEEKTLPLMEYPLVVMDVNMTSCRDRKHAKMVEEVILFAQTVKSYGGVLTLLWHNSQCTSNAKKAYETILSHIDCLGYNTIILPEDATRRLEIIDRNIIYA